MYHIWTQELEILGDVTVACNTVGICAVLLESAPEAAVSLAKRLGAPGEICRSSLAQEALLQLGEFVGQARRHFDLPLAPHGTEFQREVWSAVYEIPYGQTRTYSQIAAAIGRPKAVRAVGAANGANPLCIVVPCHRVIGSNGGLTGYAYGLALKEQLLKMEARVASRLAVA